MFLRRLFGKKKAPEPAQLGKLTIDSLQERVDELKREKLADAQSKLNPLLNRLSGERESLLNGLKTLSKVELTGEVYSGLRKSAIEARRLLVDKLTRAFSAIQPRGEFSTDYLATLNNMLTKTVNLTTDAVAAHGRYVRALFARQFDIIELHLRRLYELAIEIHTLTETTLKEMRSLDSISSKISSRKELFRRIENLQANAKSLEGQTTELEKLIEDESTQLARLVNSKEFKSVDASGRELEQIEHEMANVRGAASSAISALSRPLRKMEKLVAAGKYQMDREEIKILELCIENPLEIFSSGEKLAAAEALLRRMIGLLEEGRISLGDRERKKRTKLASELLEEKRLLELGRRLERLHAQREAKKRAREGSPLLRQRAELERLIKKHRLDLERTRKAIEDLHRESQLTAEEMDKNRGELKKVVSSVLGAELEITS
jgi:hypothetical protein